MRDRYIFPLGFALAFLPAVVFASETLDERIVAELRLIQQANVKLMSLTDSFIRELDRESCMKVSSQGAAPMSPSCKDQSVRHLEALDENNNKSAEYGAEIVEGFAKAYGMLHVAHAECGFTGFDFEVVPAFLRAQSSVVNRNADSLISMYIDAAENALDRENLNATDCKAVQSLTARMERSITVMRHLTETVR